MRPLGSLEDGTPYYAPLGQLPRDPQEDRVQCHLCGEWYRLVGGTHLSRTHGWTLADYRDAFRLPQQTPTCSPGLSQERRAQTLPRIGDGPFGVPPPAEAGERGRRTRAVARWRSLAANRPNLVAELHPTRNGELDPYRIGASSTRKLWWLCRACAHEWRASPAHRSRGRGCPSCARTRQGHRQGRVPRQRSLAAKHPELLAELHPTRNGELDPYQLPARSSRKIWWRCGGCGYAWQAVVGNRSNGSGCPRCGQRERARTLARVPRERSLAVKHPQLVAELHPSRNQDLDPYSLAPGSDRKIWWQCSECGHAWNAAPKGRTARGYGCPRCARERRARSQAGVAPGRSLAAKRPGLLEELHPTRNGDLDPQRLAAGSSRKLWWRCPRCRREWRAVVSDRNRGAGCPRCGRASGAAKQRRVPGQRSLAVKHPELLEELDPTRNGDLDPAQLGAGSKLKVWWRCSRCG